MSASVALQDTASVALQDTHNSAIKTGMCSLFTMKTLNADVISYILGFCKPSDKEVHDAANIDWMKTIEPALSILRAFKKGSVIEESRDAYVYMVYASWGEIVGILLDFQKHSQCEGRLGTEVLNNIELRLTGSYSFRFHRFTRHLFVDISKEVYYTSYSDYLTLAVRP